MGLPNDAKFGANTPADCNVRRIVDSVLGQMELTALPSRAAQVSPAGGAQPGMIVGDDMLE